MMSAQQCRAARALVAMSQKDLADQAGVGLSTVRNLETERAGVAITEETVQLIQSALEKAGVEFIPAGVRLVRRSKT
jgi:transcriptional regulator with XRE-family HTH domain